MRIGLFGGTFDPPHYGHLIAAQDACEALALDRILFIPAGSPPHKQERRLTPAAVRVEMVRQAIAGDARFVLDDRETRRRGPSYTVDTLRDLRRESPDAEFHLLIGSDQYAELDTWRGVPEIRRLSRIAVLDREGAGAVGGEDQRVRVTRVDISASDLRRRAAAGRSLRYLVPPAVLAIIEAAGLYVAAGPAERHRNESAAAG